MTLPLIAFFAAFAAAAAALAAWSTLSLRQRQDRFGERIERGLREELARARAEQAELAARQRQELSSALASYGQTLAAHNASFGQLLTAQFDSFAQRLDGLVKLIDERLKSLQLDARDGRQEATQSLQQFGETLARQLSLLHEAQAQRMQELRGGVETRLLELQTENSAKLEEMRHTVDEKLHATLEQRLGESFKLVSERLEQVHRGLGEMQSLAAGVGDLNRMLTGVKTRGLWGEVQLENLLEQMLTPQQYEKNVATRRGANERVEFAIRLPGRDAAGTVVWLPIDAKFPREDYERLLDAQERADAAGVAEAGRQLEVRIKNEARSIRDKYLDPPHTTDFAVMFLPTEGLYAEVLRRPGVSEHLQREFRVTLAGPTTLTALLNSLQMGFRTLAIERRSGEVWSVLGAVKTEFGKFGDVLAKTRKKLEEASNSIGNAEVRTRAIERQLRGVEALPDETQMELLDPPVDEAQAQAPEDERVPG